MAGPPSVGLVVFVLAPALVAAIVLAVGLGLVGAPAAPAGDPSRAKAELDSSPRLSGPERVVAFPSGADTGLGPAPSSGPRPAPPARLSVPDAGIRAAVEAVGATREGIEVPPPGRTGWYRGGPRPGEPGRAVIVGHVDTRRGPAVFAGLRALRRGDEVSVRDRRGRSHRYSVVAKEQVAKTGFPARDVYGATARRVLVLVTCGGPFRPGRGYRDNVIVYARAD